MDVTQAIKDAKGGAVEFRVEKAGIVQAGTKVIFSATSCLRLDSRDEARIGRPFAYDYTGNAEQQTGVHAIVAREASE